MPVVQESIVINRPPDRVFAYIATSDYVPLWDSSIVAVEQLGTDPLAVGTRLRGTTSMLGRRINWTTEVVEYDPPWKMTSKTIESPVDFTVSFTLSPTEDGRTQVLFRVEAAGVEGVFGRFADSLVGKAQARNARTSLERLSRLASGHRSSLRAAEEFRTRRLPS